ncbi:MAG TPA: DNA mismatch repair endonuclease MutL [Clostridiaceae bacterium]|nr:DNA mismatch repair endonuclease MutL [Clostridiaceae bacterium]
MGKIVILDENTANQIAAGEVIERPASVVKEMVENSIDAGATQITVEIRNGGISYIRVTDNGNGIEGDDLEFAFERHATSKIRRIEDLDSLTTMGFRGEALASVASVSHLEATSKTRESSVGNTLKIEGGRVVSIAQAGCPDGTTFIVRNLFYNTPARYKFLKKDSTEAGYVSDIIERLALANPGISFKFIQNGQTQLHTPGNHDLLSTIYSIFGKEIASSLIPVDYSTDGFSLTGFIGKPEIARGNRNSQYIYLNGRYIKNRILSKALEDSYKTRLMQNKFPFCVLMISTSPRNYDVNVHPQKLEVRFANENAVYSLVYHGCESALLGQSMIRSFEPGLKEEKPETIQVSKQEEIRPIPEIKTVKTVYVPETKQESLFEEKRPVVEPPRFIEKTTRPVFIEKTEIHDAVKEAKKEEEKISEPTEPFRDNEPAVSGNSATELLEATIVGQAFDTYILLQRGDNLYIIDQHAAHERIRFETLKNRLQKEESFSQSLLEPYIIKLNSNEFGFVMSKLDEFNKIGFEIEAFGLNTVIVRSVPDFYDTSFSAQDFIEILDRWSQTGAKQTGISDEALFMISCKGALKANRSMSREEIRGLVESLAAMENPYTCVHGRPIILTLDKKEFEKRFKRIV